MISFGNISKVQNNMVISHSHLNNSPHLRTKTLGTSPSAHHLAQVRQVKLLATGKYLPKNQVTAEQLGQKLGIEAAWIEKKSGVKVRHFVQDETASQMGAMAAKKALETAGLSLNDIDCIVCTSSVPEQSIPCTAALVQKKLGGESSGIATFDINSTCLSFVVGLDTLSYLVDAGRYSRVLLVASEIALAVDWNNRETSTLFGDGAAAAIISKTDPQEGSKIICSRQETYSEGAELSQCLAGGNRYHPREYSDNLDRFLFKMQGRAIYRLASQILPGFLERLLQPAGLTLEEIDFVIPHQASLMAMGLIRKGLNIPEEKWMVIAHNHGNTIAASIPMTLHEAIQQDKIHRGDRILLLGTSAGFSVGGMVLEY